MEFKLLPSDVLLGRLAVHEYRAWSRCWSDSLEAMYERAPSLPAVKWFADLTQTPEKVISDVRRSSTHRDELLQNLAAYWATSTEPRERVNTWRLPNGVVGVEPPCDLSAVTRYAIDWKSRHPVLKPFVTADLLTLTQLQIAIEHAGGDEPVLIMGETGTGKGALAKAIHDISGRSRKRFLALNCTAIPAQLIESELFGHRKGAFSGATEERKGLVAAAEDGTLFLDEIGDLAPEAQPKLLRLLREREYRRVGDAEVKETGARFIAATNAKLVEKIANDKYREDLFQRLSACRIVLPPLRERSGDVELLVNHFLAENGHSKGISEPARSLLLRYGWPGNIAELSDAMAFAARAAAGRLIDVSHLPDDIVADTYPRRGTAAQVLLATHAATEISGADMGDALSAILDDQLSVPPAIGGDEEVDALVQAIIGMGSLISKQTPAELEAAVAQVRSAALLAELRHVASEVGHSDKTMIAIDSRLNERLNDIKGVPMAGIVTEVLINILGSDDPADRSRLREFALKLKRSGPLVARAVLPAFQNLARQQETLRAQASINNAPALPQGPARFAKAPNSDWKDEVNRPAIEAALREANGVKARAAKLLQIGQPYFQSLVKMHGLASLSTELRTAAKNRAMRPQPTQTT